MGIDEVGMEIRGELTKFEQQLLLRQEFVVVRGKVKTFHKVFHQFSDSVKKIIR